MIRGTYSKVDGNNFSTSNTMLLAWNKYNDSAFKFCNSKFSLNSCEINQCSTLPNVHSHLLQQTPFLILNVADLTEERRKCELKRPMNYVLNLQIYKFCKTVQDLGLLLQLLLLCAFSLKRSTISEAFTGNIKRTWWQSKLEWCLNNEILPGIAWITCEKK